MLLSIFSLIIKQLQQNQSHSSEDNIKSLKFKPMPKINKFKVVLVGDQNVGKTSIISRFIHDTFQQSSNPTVGIDFITKTMQVDGETLRLQLWDTAGQERFRSLIPSYVRDADACLVVLDLQSRTSFQGLNKWIDFVRQTKGQQGILYLVGNKADVKDRQISTKQMQDWAQKHNYPYLQVSAKVGTNIQAVFRKVSQKLMQSRKQQTDGKSPIKNEKKENPKGQQKQTIVLNKKQATQQNGATQGCQC